MYVLLVLFKIVINRYLVRQQKTGSSIENTYQYVECVFKYFMVFCTMYMWLMLEENIALGKPTWQEHPWPDDRFYHGNNAVDGLYSDRSIEGSQCTTSANNKSTATWRVDLGSVVSISHIDIYYRTDNKPSMT